MLLEFLAEQLLAQDYSNSQLPEAPNSALRTTSLLSLNLSHNELPACLPVNIAGEKILPPSLSCFTICLCISPDLDRYRATKRQH